MQIISLPTKYINIELSSPHLLIWEIGGLHLFSLPSAPLLSLRAGPDTTFEDASIDWSRKDYSPWSRTRIVFRRWLPSLFPWNILLPSLLTMPWVRDQGFMSHLLTLVARLRKPPYSAPIVSSGSSTMPKASLGGGGWRLASVTAGLGLQSEGRVIMCLKFIKNSMSTLSFCLSLSLSLSLTLCFFHFLSDCGIKPEVSLSQTKEGKEGRRTRTKTGSYSWSTGQTLGAKLNSGGAPGEPRHGEERAQTYWAQLKKVIGT